jgi:hypothetical protein
MGRLLSRFGALTINKLLLEIGFDFRMLFGHMLICRRHDQVLRDVSINYF